MKTFFLHTMKREFLISLILHLCFFGAVVVFGHSIERSRGPVLVYLTDELPGGGSGGSSGPAALPGEGGRHRTPSVRLQSRKEPAMRSLSTTRTPARDIEKNKKEEEHSISDRPEAGADMASVSNGQPQRAGGGEGGPGTGGGAGFGPGSGGGTGSGHGQGVGNGRGSANAKMQYLKVHFAYIRDLIMKHLAYPHMARKMGWKGKVVVAFIVRENGTVENTRVLRSSGYEVLDRNTLKTVNDAQPFPKPPVKAEIIIPIVYKLE